VAVHIDKDRAREQVSTCFGRWQHTFQENSEFPDNDLSNYEIRYGKVPAERADLLTLNSPCPFLKMLTLVGPHQ
jgi:hypothetical protein